MSLRGLCASIGLRGYGIVLLGLTLVTAAGGAETAPPTAARPAAVAQLSQVAPPQTLEVNALPRASARRAAMVRELSECLERSKREVASFTVARDASDDPLTRAAIDHRIVAVKRAAQLEFFRIQLREASADGRTADVAELERVIAAYQKSIVAPADPVPAPRTAPPGRTLPARPEKKEATR